ncbi:MAG: AAA family ATPase [Cyclobacteriaceae bacterium]|jgi:predicted kinase|nr:AAA family ATPase [Flammeovirgaceae bacterium]
MEAIIFCGIQATGKSSFYKEHFFTSHVRISLDQLHTRNKEQKFLETCLETQQPFVIDNTNPTKEERAKYIEAAKAKKYKIIGYYFRSQIAEALVRNGHRFGKEKIPDVGIRNTFSRLEIPSYEEGFDELHYVQLENQSFTIKPWTYEV